MSKTAIVTGASRGIGRETAIALAEQGQTVVALARSEEQLKLLEDRFSNVRVYPTDLTEEAEVQKFVLSFHERFGQTDLLINNAGHLVNKPFEDLDKNDWQEMLDANLLSNVLLTKSLLPYFSARAHIVNISSMGGFQGSSKFPGLSAYSVAKGAVSILSECLAVELAGRGISINTLCLGAVQTEMFDRAFPGFDAPVTAEQMGKYIANFALNGSDLYNGQILPVTLADPG